MLLVAYLEPGFKSYDRKGGEKAPQNRLPNDQVPGLTLGETVMPPELTRSAQNVTPTKPVLTH